jgi:predicted small secreted protein
MANVNNYFTRKRLKYFIFAFHNKQSNYKQTKTVTMKKLMTLTLAGIVLTLVLAACKSTSGHGCDAYGKLDQTTNTDLASK